MLSTTHKRPLAILAVAGGLLAVAAGPATASQSAPTHTQTKATTSLKVTMEDILVTSVSVRPDRSLQALENTLVSSVRVAPEHARRERRRKHRHHGGKGGGVTAMYDVSGQNHV